MTTPAFIAAVTELGPKQKWTYVPVADIAEIEPPSGKLLKNKIYTLRLKDGTTRYTDEAGAHKLTGAPRATLEDTTGQRLIVFANDEDRELDKRPAHDIYGVIVPVVGWEVFPRNGMDHTKRPMPIVRTPPGTVIRNVEDKAWRHNYAIIEPNGIVRCQKHLIYGEHGEHPFIERLWPDLAAFWADVEVASWAKERRPDLLPKLAEGRSLFEEAAKEILAGKSAAEVKGLAA